MRKKGLLGRIITKNRQLRSQNTVFEAKMGRIMACERVIEGFFEKFPNRRLPHTWVEALRTQYELSHNDVLLASRRVRARLDL